MGPPSIVFFCPACGVKLMLPSHLAGIAGPCPACQRTIQSPSQESLRAQPQLAQAAPRPNPPPAPPEPTQPTGIKDGPRQLPAGTVAAPLAANLAPDEKSKHPGAPVPSIRRRPAHSLRRFTVPALFLAALVALVIGIVQFINKKSDVVTPAAEDSRVKHILGDDHSPTTASTPQPAVPVVVNATAAAGKSEPGQPGISALKTLEAFLAADNLDDRLEMIETRATPETLANSCLAGKLAYTTIETTFQVTNETERATDCYYRVGFMRDDGKNYLQTMLVRIRGLAPPSVVVDPLLDLYGGRLAAYAATPTDKPGYFHVVLCALSLPPDNWPNADSKFTIKLQSDDKADSSVATVIADRMSGIGKALNDSAITGLRWGQYKPCYVMLQWNLENPSKPYLEALDVKRLDWNP